MAIAIDLSANLWHFLAQTIDFVAILWLSQGEKKCIEIFWRLK